MTIKLISFDLDDTLWDNRAVLARSEAEVEAFFQTYCPQVLAKYSMADINAQRQALMQNPAWQHQISGVRLQGYQQVLGEFMPPEQALGLAARAFSCFMRMRNQVDLFSDCEAVLEQLSQAYSLVALTNGNADIDAVGLGRYFKHAWSAELLNSSKPNAAHFERVLEAYKLQGEQVLHIGDHPRDDVWAAQQQGFKTVWFNPGQLKWEQLEPVKIQGQLIKLQARPNFEVQSLNQIPALLGL